MEGRHLKASALWYRNWGCSVIPLEGKKPLISWERYQNERASIEQIGEWWTEWPRANVGIVTGKISGLIVLDIDGPVGEQTLKDQKLHLPPTVTTKTGGNGWHYYFKYPDFECSNFAGRLPGIDFRGDGGYVVAPPSYHPNGTKYDWAISPKEETPAEAPGWLLKLIQECGDVSALSPEVWTDNVTEGNRNDHLARLAGSLLSKMSKDDALTMLLAWNDARCKPPLPEKEIARVVTSITINKTLNRPPGGGWKLEETKTDKSIRTIPIPPAVMTILKEHKSDQREEIIGAEPGEYTNHRFIFAAENGEPADGKNILRRHFKPLLEKAKLLDMRLYDLRHTCATLLFQAGENPKKVSERLGHADITLTLNTYTHMLPDMQQSCVDKLNPIFENRHTKIAH